MCTKHQFRIVLIVLVLGSLLFARPMPTVAQQSDPMGMTSTSVEGMLSQAAAPVVVPGGPGFFSANGLVFTPYINLTTPVSYAGRAIYNPDTVSHAYEAQVMLPHGATITKFVIWVKDNDAAYDMWAAIGRMGQDDSSVLQVAYVASTGAATGSRVFEDTTMTSPTVDLQNYAYWVEIWLPQNSAAGLVSFRIDYTYGSYMPVITRP